MSAAAWNAASRSCFFCSSVMPSSLAPFSSALSAASVFASSDFASEDLFSDLSLVRADADLSPSCEDCVAADWSVDW